MDKLDMFQERFGKVYKFGWWDMDRIQTDDGNVFYPKGVSGGLSVCGLQLVLAPPDHQEMNVQAEVTCLTLKTIAY